MLDFFVELLYNEIYVLGSLLMNFIENKLSFFKKGVDKLMEDLLKCVSRAKLCCSFALLCEYVGCFALLENGFVFGCAKRVLCWDFSPLERSFGTSFIFWRGLGGCQKNSSSTNIYGSGYKK